MSLVPLADLPVWSFDADWSDDVLERYMFLTDVLASNSGAEQRRGVRATPRRQLEFNVMFAGQERSFFDLALQNLGGSDFLFPLYPDGSRTTADVTFGAGAKAIPCNTRGREFESGGYALLRKNAFTFETILIDGLTEDSIHTVGGVVNNWPAGTRVYPCKRGRLSEMPQTTGKTASVLTSSVVMDLIGAAPWTGDPATLETFEGDPVYLISPNWSDDLTNRYSRLQDLFDNDMGVPFRVERSDRSFLSQTYNWFLRGREDHDKFRALLYAIDGRRKAFWLPTFTGDLQLINRIAANNSGPSGTPKDTLDFKRIGYHYVAGGGAPIPGREVMRVAWADGTSSYHTIISTADGAGGPPADRIGVTPWLTAGATDVIPPIRAIQFLRRVRLEADTIEMAHKTDSDGVTVVETTVIDFRPSIEPDAGQAKSSGVVGAVGAGVSWVLEISSPHYDFTSLFGGFVGLAENYPVGFDPGNLSTALDLTQLIDMPSVLALFLCAQPETAGPTISGSDWTTDFAGTGTRPSNTRSFKYAAGHAGFTYGDTAELEATWAGPGACVGAFALLNDSRIVQSAVAVFNILDDGGAGVALPDVPASGNWLVHIFFGATGAVNTNDDVIAWRRVDQILPTWNNAPSISLLARRVP